jgi:cyclophilin family peptidyl-prolyl cis-trans isomerase
MPFARFFILFLFFLASACSHSYVRPADYRNPQLLISTDLGEMQVELYEDRVPNLVSNFIQLAEQNFYDGVSFHNCLPGIALQGGCPNSRSTATGVPGTGGPGYELAAEFDRQLTHDSRGQLSMVNNVNGNLNGSQFFITLAPLPLLDGESSLFGRITSGEGVLQKIEKSTEPVSFSIRVLRKNDLTYKVNKINP